MSLTAEQNLRLTRRDIDEALGFFPDLQLLLSRKAGLRSGGEQQILTLARVLLMKPRLLLFDAISLCVAPVIVLKLFKAPRQEADDGIGVLLVEQPAHRALDIADRG